jgi:hypothetical protein
MTPSTHRLQSRYAASQTLLLEGATRATASTGVDVTSEAYILADRFAVSRKKRSASEYTEVATYLLSNYAPEVAYFIAVELNKQFEPRLGYPPIGQVMVAMEIEGNERAARWIACSLRNFPNIETARLAFGVIKSPAMRSLVRADFAAENVELAEYICSGEIAKSPPETAPPVTEPIPQTKDDRQAHMSDGIERMPRRLTDAEHRGDRLYLHLQVLATAILLLSPVLGGVLGGWTGAGIGLVFGGVTRVWMRCSMGLRGSNPHDAFFIRMRERARGARCGILEALIEKVRRRQFTQVQCVAITKAWDDTRERLEMAASVEERRQLLNALDAEIKRISYVQDD